MADEIQIVDNVGAVGGEWGWSRRIKSFGYDMKPAKQPKGGEK